MELYYPLILDGATGTQLQKRGFTGGVCTEEWVLEHPQALMEVQRLYAEAGSEVVYAPTFSATSVKLEENGIFNRVAEYNRRLVQVSRDAVGDRCLIAGDMSPTGKFIRPVGDLSFEDLVDIYTEQVAAQEEAGVDLFVIETTMTLPEARAALLAVRSVSRKPVFVTFTCDDSGRTVSGTDVTAALSVMQGMGVTAFGLNCSAGPDMMLRQLQRLHVTARVPLIAKPNAGLPEMRDGQYIYNCPPEEFVTLVPEMAKAGVCIFGGCCGTDERYIAALREALADVECPGPAPAEDDLLYPATEKDLFPLPADVAVGTPIACSTSLADDIEADADNPAPVTAVRIDRPGDIDLLADSAWALTKPLCIVCDDASLLEGALRVFQGRALYQGSLSEESLLPLRDRYGLIL